MSVASAWVLYGVQTPSSFYGSLQDATPAPVLDLLTEFAGGHPEPLFTGVQGAGPEIVFSTFQVGTAFAEFGHKGADLSAGNVDLFYRLADDHGDRVAPASMAHVRLRMANAFAYIRSFRAGRRQNATCEIRIVSPFDGANAPIVPAGSQALGGTPAGTEFYHLGPVSVNGAAVDGVQELAGELNPELAELGDDAEIYSSFVYLRRVRPVLTLRGLDAQAWATYGLTGTALTAAAAYLTRRDPDGGNETDISTVHAKVSGTNGLISVDRTSGGQDSEAETALQLNLRAPDTSSNSITLAGGVAIT